MKLRTFLPNILFLLATAATISAQAEKPKALPPKTGPAVSSADKKLVPAPAFNLTSLEGKTFNLSALRGKVVVLNLWFTGCPPCLAEMPELNALVDKFKNDEVVFIAPTWDKAAILPGFLKQYPFKYSIVADAGDLIIDTYGDGTKQVELPTHLVIDKQGNIDTKIVGPLIKDGSTAKLGELTNVITRLTKKSPDNTKVKVGTSL